MTVHVPSTSLPLASPPHEAWRIDIPSVTIDERVHLDKHVLLWQVRGATDLTINDETIVLPLGHAVWVSAGSRHAFTVRHNSVVLPLFFESELTATTLERTTMFAVGRELRTLFLALLQSQNSIIRPAISLGHRILSLIEEFPPPAAALPLPTSAAALTVAKTLKRTPGDERTTEELAFSVHTSVRTIERAFLAETGFTLGQWRWENRMEAAGALLRAQSPIPAVASRVGYQSVSSFGRAFRRRFDMTPGTYSARYRADS